MIASVEILDKLRQLPIKTVILLYLANRYPDWVHYQEIIDFTVEVKGTTISTVHKLLKKTLYEKLHLIERAYYGRKAIYYRIHERGLKWIRFKMYVEKKIPEELKVPSVDLVRVRLSNGVEI